MYKFTNKKFDLFSDFEIRVVREDDSDIDLLVPLDSRTLNILIDKMPDFLDSRFQFTKVRNVVIRLTKDGADNCCTIHLLDSVDIHSAIMNFTMNYEDHCIYIVRDDYTVGMNLRKKNEE